jgi:hypothetical protein
MGNNFMRNMLTYGNLSAYNTHQGNSALQSIFGNSNNSETLHTLD